MTSGEITARSTPRVLSQRGLTRASTRRWGPSRSQTSSSATSHWMRSWPTRLRGFSSSSKRSSPKHIRKLRSSSFRVLNRSHRWSSTLAPDATMRRRAARLVRATAPPRAQRLRYRVRLLYLMLEDGFYVQSSSAGLYSLSRPPPSFCPRTSTFSLLPQEVEVATLICLEHMLLVQARVPAFRKREGFPMFSPALQLFIVDH